MVIIAVSSEDMRHSGITIAVTTVPFTPDETIENVRLILIHLDCIQHFTLTVTFFSITSGHWWFYNSDSVCINGVHSFTIISIDNTMV